MKKEHLFLIVFGLIFVTIAVVFLTFPRSTFSKVERRELKTFPSYSHEKLRSGEYATEVSSWFSDSEPYRDELMQLSMMLKENMGLKWQDDEEQITFHESTPGNSLIPADAAQAEPGDQRDIKAFDGEIADEKTHTAEAGILIVGSVPKIRALINYGGSPQGGSSYAAMVNEYKEKLGKDVDVYCMIIPTAIEFYCPPKVRAGSKRIKQELPTIKNVYGKLRDDVKAVDVYTVLGKHVNEPIYLRTDHHWAPLGAHYAAGALASVAGVPFRPLSDYNQKTIHDFVGTMFGYSKDASVQQSPEDFVYYVPKDDSYVTTVTQFKLDKDFRITGEMPACRGQFFHNFKDGSSQAYSVFMGGDAMIVKVRTGVKNGRRLVIMKDSYGNAVPSNLFGSFEEVHVVDFRYFPKNIVKYVRDNKITDLAFCNNVFIAVSESAVKNYRDMLTN